jgi:hypothetical protein
MFVSCDAEKKHSKDFNKEKDFYDKAVQSVKYTELSVDNILLESDSITRCIKTKELIYELFRPNCNNHYEANSYLEAHKFILAYRRILTSNVISEPTNLFFNGLNRFFEKNKADIYSLKFYNKHKNIILGCIDKKTAEKIGVLQIIRDLKDSYSFIKTQNYTETFKMINQKNINVKIYFYTNRFSYKLKKPEYPYADYHSWLYSFWYRRYLEGNMETVYQILQEIDEHYEKQK